MWKYFPNLTGDSGKLHGALDEASARRIHEKGGMYVVAKDQYRALERAVVVNTESPFVSIKERDHKARCRYSWNFGRAGETELLSFAQGFYFFSENTVAYTVKLTVTMASDGTIFLEKRNRVSGEVIQNSFTPQETPKPLSLPTFGDYLDVFSYKEPLLSQYVNRYLTKSCE